MPLRSLSIVVIFSKLTLNTSRIEGLQVMGICCKGVSEIPSVPFHFLAVQQTMSHNMIFTPDPKVKQLVLWKVMVNSKVVIFFSGFGMGCFVSSSDGNDSNLCSVEYFYDYMVSILCFFPFPPSGSL